MCYNTIIRSKGARIMSEKKLPHQHGNEEIADFLNQHLSKTENFQIVADVFKQLGDSSRMRIFWLLCHCEECVINISTMVSMSSPAVSHHLKQLKDSGLIVSRRDGKEVYYKAAATEQSRLLHLAIEKTMEISCPESGMNTTHDVDYYAVEVGSIKEVHDYLVEHIDKRVTIEELARMFLMNTTTLKSDFKTAYGVSVATHVKEHRLKKAAELLKDSSQSIEEIAKAVGYESQSKFTAAFKGAYGVTPMRYRKG